MFVEQWVGVPVLGEGGEFDLDSESTGGELVGEGSVRKGQRGASPVVQICFGKIGVICLQRLMEMPIIAFVLSIQGGTRMMRLILELEFKGNCGGTIGQDQKIWGILVMEVRQHKLLQ